MGGARAPHARDIRGRRCGPRDHAGRVDVLGTPELVDSTDALDCRRNGVIVSTTDGRRGLLLPDLDGMNTIDEQLRIAARKGGVGLGSDRVCLERFTVTRHV